MTIGGRKNLWKTHCEMKYRKLVSIRHVVSLIYFDDLFHYGPENVRSSCIHLQNDACTTNLRGGGATLSIIIIHVVYSNAVNTLCMCPLYKISLA